MVVTNKRRFTVWFTLVLLVAAACCAYLGEAAPEVKPKRGGTLTIGMGADIQKWDVHNCSGMQGLGIQRLVTETVTDHHWETGKLLPGLVESWQASKDATKWTVKLKKGVKFHDGTPFNAAAFKYNVERLLKIGLARGSFDMIQSVEVVDDYTARINTTPFAPLMHLFTYAPMGMISPTQAEKLGWDNYYKAPVGTGPYKFVEHVKGDRSVLVANDDYYGGRPLIDKIVMKVVPDVNARIAALEAGDIDVCYDVPPTEVPRLAANPDIVIIRARPARTIYIGLNCQWGPLKDRRVRQALNYAVDKQAIIKSIFAGEGEVSTAPFTKLAFGYFEQEPYTYNPKKAKALLAEAGYPNGFKMTLTYSPGRYLLDTQVVDAVASYLRDIGLDVTLQPLEWAAMGKELLLPVEQSKIQSHFIGWGCVTLDADHALKNFRPDQWPPKSNSPIFYDNPQFMPHFEAARNTADEEERLAHYKVLDKMVWEDAPAIWLYEQPSVYAVRKEVKNVHIRSDETIWVKDAWLDR